MGKSTAARLFESLGVPVHDSDKAAHAALEPSGAAFNAVKSHFPESFDAKTNRIDRKKLGALVFANTQRLKTLESILHPMVHKSQADFIRIQKLLGKKQIVLEIPLLFETGAQSRVDYIVCVSAPDAIQRRRVLSRVGMTDQKLQDILARQIPDTKKQAMSDFIVHTGLGLARTHQDIKNILKQIR